MSVNLSDRVDTNIYCDHGFWCRKIRGCVKDFEKCKEREMHLRVPPPKKIELPALKFIVTITEEVPCMSSFLGTDGDIHNGPMDYELRKRDIVIRVDTREELTRRLMKFECYITDRDIREEKLTEKEYSYDYGNFNKPFAEFFDNNEYKLAVEYAKMNSNKTGRTHHIQAIDDCWLVYSSH